jgi:YD repeat-containing protein
LGNARNTVRTYVDLITNTQSVDASGTASGDVTWKSRTEIITETVDGISQTTTIKYNKDNSILEKTLPDGTVIRNSVNGLVQRVTETPVVGPVRTTTATLDATGHLVRKEVSTSGISGSDVHTWNWSNGLLLSDCKGEGSSAVCTQRAYDGSNRLFTVTDPAGVVTTNVYLSSTSEQPDSVTFADGTGERYTRDILGRITAVKNSLGQTRTTAYDALGRDTLSRNYDGVHTRTVYDGPDLVRLQEGGLVGNGIFRNPIRTHRYEVDAYGRRLKEWIVSSREVLKRKSVVDAFGNVVEVWDNPESTNSDSAKWRLVERNQYDGRNHMLQHRTFPNGTGSDSLVTKYVYDALGHAIQETDPRGGVDKRSYDPWGNVLRDTNALGNVVRHGYDQANRIVSDTNALGQVTTHSYDAQGNEVQRVDAVHGATQLWIYQNGRLTKEQSAEGSWTTYQYDALGRVVQVVRKRGDSAFVADTSDVVTGYAYDAVGHRVRETVSGAVQHRYGVDAGGRVLADTNALGEVTSYSYDRLGRVVQTISPAQDTMYTEYDAQGRVSTRRLGSDTLSVVSYDDADRPVWERTPGHGAITRVYDRTDYVTQTTDSIGTVTKFMQDRVGRDSSVSVAGQTARKTIRDLAGRVIQQLDERSNKVSMAYDALDRLTTLIDNEGNATAFTYVDSVGGWRRTTAYPDGKTESHIYDREGRLRRFVDGRGVVASYGYDSLSRLSAIAYTNADGSVATDSIKLRYDAQSRLVRAANGADSVVTTYDTLGRPLTSTQTVAGFAYAIGYAYDDPHRSRTLTLPDGSAVTQKWTARGLLDSLRVGSRLLARYGYSNGLETSRTLGNGISLAQGFDAGGRLTSMAYSLAGQTLPSLGFGYDIYGNRALVRRNHATTTSEAMSYTADNQLSAWTKGTADASGNIASPTSSQSWTLDSRGNWSSWTQSGTAQTRTHSTANELTAMGGTALTWDAAGNLTSDGTLTYAWGPRGTLDTVKQGATVKGIYSYDPLGRRSLKTAGGLRTVSVYDGWQCVWQTVTGAILDTTKTFTYGNYVDEPVALIRKAGSWSDTAYYLQGNNYSVEALTDRNGAVVERYEYTPYGVATVYTGAGADGSWFTSDDIAGTVSARGNALTFQGRELDAESGEYYFRNRYYQSVLV